MGARPFGYLLASAWPLAIEEDWIAAFAVGLAQDQARYDIALYGGDTTATPGPMTPSLTALGTVSRTDVLDRASLTPGTPPHVTGPTAKTHPGPPSLRGALGATST